MIELIEQLHQTGKLNSLQLAPEKSFFTERSLLFFFGNDMGNQKSKAIHSKVKALHKPQKLTNKRELIRIISSMFFYSKFVENPSPSSSETLFYTL